MVLLSAWLDSTETPVAVVADKLGVAPSTVYRWRDGLKVPRPEQIEALQRLTSGRVTANDHQAAFTARQRILMGKTEPNHRAVSNTVAGVGDAS